MRRRVSSASARLAADVHSFARSPFRENRRGTTKNLAGKKSRFFARRTVQRESLWTQYYQYWYGLARECWDASRDPSSRRLVSTTARAHPARNRNLW